MTRRLLAVVGALLLTAVSCHGVGHGFHVVGASRMAQIETANDGHGSTCNGCGYIEGPQGVVELTPPTQPITVVTVNAHDRFRQADLTRYTEVHNYYAAYGPVVWVEVPPLPGLLSEAAAEDFNANVAAELGCDLVPWQVQDAETFDGLHYTTAGADLVTLRFSQLGAAEACQ